LWKGIYYRFSAWSERERELWMMKELDSTEEAES